MIELTELQYMVYEILRDNEECRNSDNLLYVQILEKNNVNIHGTSIAKFFTNFSDFSVPRFESVTRARRKVQELLPELESVDQVRKWRKENETMFREYSKEKRINRSKKHE